MESLKKNKLRYQEYLRRESGIRHHRYDEELRLFVTIKSGDSRGIELGMDMFFSALCGQLSMDELRNYKYLFVCSATLITRFCIEGGMDEEYAYNASDSYIQQADQCENLDHLQDLYREMLTFYTNHMAALKKKQITSKPVVLCMDYIYSHLYEKITVDTLAKYVGLNSNYLSGLFKRETGQSISNYISDQRMEAAKQMLLYSDFSCSEIAAQLAYSSQSYFTKQFRNTFGCTPQEYRNRNFQLGFERSWTGNPNDPYPSAPLVYGA